MLKKIEAGLLLYFLGHNLYVNCLRNFDLVIGNSSSGIIETPTFKIPTINLGDRQREELYQKISLIVK